MKSTILTQMCLEKRHCNAMQIKDGVALMHAKLKHYVSQMLQKYYPVRSENKCSREHELEYCDFIFFPKKNINIWHSHLVAPPAITII